MSWPSNAFKIAACSFLSCAWGQRSAQIKPPQPVTVKEVHPLPYFCIQEGLQQGRKLAKVRESTRQPSWTPPGPNCAPRNSNLKAVYVPPANADDVAKQLQPSVAGAAASLASVTASAGSAGSATATATGTGAPPVNEFTLTPTADKRAEIIFCRVGACRQSDLLNLLSAIDDLAKPEYAYFHDYSILSEDSGKSLAKALPNINAKLKGELISTTTLRVESDQPLSDAEFKIFEKQFNPVRAAVEANEKFKTAIPEPVSKLLKPPTPDVEAAAIEMPYFCQANDLKTLPVAVDFDKACPANTHKIQAGNLSQVMAAVTTALGKEAPTLTLSQDGARILAACKGKCDPDVLELARDTVAATARPVPLLVADIPFPRGTAKHAAEILNAPPLQTAALTDTLVRVSSDTPLDDADWAVRLQQVREREFGSIQNQPLQRMFYQRAADVIGDLLTTPPPATPVTLGQAAATPPVTSTAPAGGGAAPSSGAGDASSSTSATTSNSGTTITNTINPPAAATPAPAASTPAPGAAPTGTVGQGMTAVDDNVVFTDTSNIQAVKQRARLLTMLDFPRPEVLMNMWSFQASSPNGKEVAETLQNVRDLVSANNDALQHSIDYGWAYLSRQMKSSEFFDLPFYDYLTQRYVADAPECEARQPDATGCLTVEQRKRWGLCPAGQYCLGYEGAFQPVRPTLTSILLTMMAAKNTSRTVLTAIGCMEGKFEVYGAECFPDRNEIRAALPPGRSDEDVKTCIRRGRADFLERQHAGKASGGDVTPITNSEKAHTLSCELLDRAAVSAEHACGLPVTLPLSCFTLEAVRTFMPDNSFSTFPLQQLNSLAEENLADRVASMTPVAHTYSTTELSLLRSAVADFLFNYKVAIQYPNDLGNYSLPHSAQELNARFNPLVVAFNQDVAAFSRTLLDEAQRDTKNQNSLFQLWRHNKSFIANGLITVRGLSGLESLVDTDTQNAFDTTHAQTLGAVLSSLLGSSSGGGSTSANSSSGSTGNTGGSNLPTCSNPSFSGSPLCSVAGLFRGSTSAYAIASALQAITPQESHTIIGRQLTLDVIPHTLPGASSAELDVRLWAQEDSAPIIYSETGAKDNDYTSRVARHNVATRVRVESVKLFDVSTFTAMVQRPRAKLPLVPPFIEIPLIGSLLSVPLPAAKIYHASSAIVSAIIVPTAADLGYGVVFQYDRAVVPEDRRFSHLPLTLRTLTQHAQFPETAFIYEYHYAMVKCLATNGSLAFTGTPAPLDCGSLSFSTVPPSR